MTEWISRAWRLTAKNLVFPNFCRSCGVRLLTEENGYFCATCWEISPRTEPPYCIRCGGPQPHRVGMGPAVNFLCAKCREQKAPGYRRIFGAAHYAGAVAEAIKLLKFHDKVRLAGPLGELMVAFAEREMEVGRYDAIVPVPLHRVRLRDRGFNQAKLLAEQLVPHFPNARLNESLKRLRPTRIQSRLKDEKARARNVVGAFGVTDDVAFDGQTILLVDDVVTTGVTVSECARALHRAGAGAVDVLAAAVPALVEPSLAPM